MNALVVSFVMVFAGLVLPAPAVAQEPPAPSAGLERAGALLDDGEPGRAAAVLDGVLALGPDRAGRAEALYLRGVARHRTGDHAGAAADFGAVIALDPDNGDAWMGRGLARARLGDESGASSDFERGIELNDRGRRP